MKSIIERIFKSNFIRNTGWIVFAQIYQMAVQLVIGVISARYLGPSNYGTINYAASYISFFTILCALGLEGIVVKEMVSNREKEGSVLGSSIVYRLIAGVLSMFSVCIIVWAVNPGDKTLLMVVFLQSLVLPFNAFNIIEMWYQSMLRSKIASIVKCIAYTVMSAYKVFLLVTGKGVEWFAFSTSLDALIIAILYMLCYRKHGTYPLKINMRVGFGLLTLSYHLIISSLMAVVYNQMDRLMIGKMIGQTEVGYYAAATTIAHMWTFIPQAFTNSARPIIMEYKNKDEGMYYRRLFQLTCFIFWVGVLFAVLITSFSHLIVDILYGAEYVSAKGPLLINIWGMIFSCLSYPRSIWMICEDKQRFVKKILAWGVVSNLILNSILIPTLGINGAAIATLVTEIVSCVIAPSVYRQTRPFVKGMVRSFVCKFSMSN